MRPLLACWTEVAQRFIASPRIALFLDFDGTLAAIESRPEHVSVAPRLRQSLAAIAQHPRFSVWIISARRRADIRARVQIPAIRYMGLYGRERSFMPAPKFSAVTRVRDTLRATLPVHPHIWIEDKQYTIAVHYRGAPDALRRMAKERVQHAVDPWRTQLRVVSGKCIREVMPRSLPDKGAAVRKELARLTTPALPVYIGDDVSDEAAFAALPEGFGIRVGKRAVCEAVQTRARYRLDGPDHVRQFLEKLRAEIL